MSEQAIENIRRVSAPRPLLRVANEAFDAPLAILPEKLETILSIVGPRLVADESALHELVSSGILRQSANPANPLRTYAWDDDEDDSDSYSSQPSKKPYQLTNDGIAVIPVSGTLMESGGWMSALSGCSSYAGITKALKMAMDEDGAVKAILFKINSPGGSTHGCFELTDLIHSYRGKKTMYAIAKHMACSAAYAIGSSADKFFVTLTGAYGSIGVFALHYDMSSADEKAGVKYTYIHYGDKKVAGNPHEPLAKSAKSDIQSEVDREGDMFVSRVARNRGASEKSISDTQAGVFYGDSQIPLLADGVSTYDEVLAKLSGKVKQSSGRMFSTAGTGTVIVTETQTGEGAMAKTIVLTADKKAQYDKALAARKQNDADIAALLADGTPVDEPADDGCDPENKKKPAAAAALPAAPAPAAAPAAVIPISIATQPAPVVAAYPAREVAEICQLSGFAASAPDYILRETPLAKVREELLAKRAATDSDSKVFSGFGTVSTDALDTLKKQADAIQANSNGTISASKAFEMALLRNPAAYKEYTNERAVAALTPAGIEKYVHMVAARMPLFGLSAEFGVR